MITEICLQAEIHKLFGGSAVRLPRTRQQHAVVNILKMGTSTPILQKVLSSILVQNTNKTTQQYPEPQSSIPATVELLG